MPSYEEVTQRARSLRSVTGVTDKAFQALLPHFEQAFEAYMGNRTIDYYSGKKKCHTLKNLVVIDETCQICCLSATNEGKVHDTILAELEGYTFPPGSCLYQDMGFQGYTCEGITIVQPKKKPPGGELTPPEKAANRAISSIRIRIEHAIGGVKRYRIVKDKIRLLKDGIRDTIMETCCGLHNFRLQYRPWNYAN